MNRQDKEKIKRWIDEPKSGILRRVCEEKGWEIIELTAPDVWCQPRSLRVEEIMVRSEQEERDRIDIDRWLAEQDVNYE